MEAILRDQRTREMKDFKMSKEKCI